MANKKRTPMLQQYFELKEQYPNALLLFRLGDFYELFGDDAREAARRLGLTLTARHKGTENEIAMCGVPHHSADKYIAQLVQDGSHVAICEQVSDPSLPGIVQREVVRVITPGTNLDESLIDTSKNHFLLSLYQGKQTTGIGFLDLATGEFRTTELQQIRQVPDLLYQLEPAEILVDPDQDWSIFADQLQQYAVTPFRQSGNKDPEELLREHFGVKTLAGFGIDQQASAIAAAEQLISYVQETQKTALDHIVKIQAWKLEEGMVLDESTLRNLELLATARDFKAEGSLLDALDQTLTRMGSRSLRQWMLRPLTDLEQISNRHQAVETFHSEPKLLQNLQVELRGFYDLERLTGRIGCRTVNARDLSYLKVNLMNIPSIKTLLAQSSSTRLSSIREQLDDCADLVRLLDQQLIAEPPVTITEGGMMADGLNEELDELRKILSNGKEWLLNYQQDLREQTGITTLKVKFNKVFGYHIEVSKAQSEKVPESFDLKQTLVNAHRYMTSELKNFEEKFLTAEERIKTLEYELFQQLLEQVIPHLSSIQNNARLIGELDILQGFAQQALKQQYVRPEMSTDRGIEIQSGRHPVIEIMLKKSHQRYIANDLKLNDERQLLLLTGPNMAGKSSYLRQTALIVLMAQMGSFVPAESARIGIVDRIFTRVGASDDISTGQSTFMVEMSEAANILNNASERSLIIFDELGRGTSTYDGVSIAWAVLEYIVQHLGAFTLFATHYHELIDVANELPQAHNASIAVTEKDGEVVFLHQVVEGGVDRSYGIEVAKLAGLPGAIIDRSKDILKELERDRLREEQQLMGAQASLFAPIVPAEPSPHRKLIEDLKEQDINRLSPLEALNYLSKLQQDLSSDES